MLLLQRVKAFNNSSLLLKSPT